MQIASTAVGAMPALRVIMRNVVKIVPLASIARIASSARRAVTVMDVQPAMIVATARIAPLVNTAITLKMLMKEVFYEKRRALY